MSEPIAGGRITLTPRADGSYRVKSSAFDDSMDRPTDNERRAFQKYDGMSRLELMRELQRYQWDAKEYREQVEKLQQHARSMPPLHLVQEMAERLRRIRVLTKVPRRRVVPVADLLDVLDKPLQWPAPDAEAAPA